MLINANAPSAHTTGRRRGSSMKRTLLFLSFAIAFCMFAMTSQAQAQATRTWVSGVGDDANPCSRTAPCKTFPGAYSRTAAGGEIDALDPGGFGTITIGKAITIDGGGGQVASILASGVPGVTVNAGANDRVTLRNLRINGIGQSVTPGTTGIVFNSGLLLNVENCFIFGFTSNGINFQPGVRAFLRVSETTIDSTGLNGSTGGIIAATTAASGANRVTITHSHVTGNGGYGITIGAHTIAMIEEVDVSRNGIIAGGDAGIFANGVGAEVNVEHSVVMSNNNSGLHSSNSAIMRVSWSDISDNAGFGVVFDTGGQLLTYSNNRVQGNASGPGTFSGTATTL
jgi:hypothetical protein